MKRIAGRRRNVSPDMSPDPHYAVLKHIAFNALIERALPGGDSPTLVGVDPCGISGLGLLLS